MIHEGIIAPIIIEPLKHIYRMLFEPEYRYYSWLVTRYGRTKRFSLRKIIVHGWDIIVPDMASFLSAYKEIFVEQIYAFRSDVRDPVILDCGANIGLSILYFKTLYPHSKITAFEADPQIFAILQRNITAHKICDVELVNKAIWSSETTVAFSVEGADGGRINAGNDKNLINVPTVSLSSLLQGTKYDFVKIDIEGAETEALRNCDEYLANLKYVFIEYHSIASTPQSLGMLINSFEKKGFRIHMHPQLISKRPFIRFSCPENGMDLQLNLFFTRDDSKAI